MYSGDALMCKHMFNGACNLSHLLAKVNSGKVGPQKIPFYILLSPAFYGEKVQGFFWIEDITPYENPERIEAVINV